MPEYREALRLIVSFAVSRAEYPLSNRDGGVLEVLFIE
jgi:hypothetical protein